MPHSNRILVAAIAIGIATLAGSSGLRAQAKAGGEKKIYCWSEGGRKVCGDALPADAANSARTEISARSGLRTGQVSRALTDAERSAAAVEQEQARLAAEAEAMRQRRDLAMVESYGTETDLRRAYGERTELLDETLKASTLGVTNLRLSLLTLLRQASDKELAGDIVPLPLTRSIRDQHGELLRQQQIRASQLLDRAALDAELQDAVVRYRALKAPPGTASAPNKPAAETPPAPPAG
jgi:hypothetical protein